MAGVLAAASVTWVLLSVSGYAPVAEAQDETGTCPGGQEVDTFTGTGNQTSDTFETTTNSFRVTYDLQATNQDAAVEPSLLS